MDGTQAPATPETDIWSEAGTTRVPFQVYQDADIYAQELEKIFYGASWNYVGLECEVPNAGDFRVTLSVNVKS